MSKIIPSGCFFTLKFSTHLKYNIYYPTPSLKALSKHTLNNINLIKYI